jgi:two-component system response regulator BaeR
MSAALKDARILIVEDEPKLARILVDYLQLDGYRTQWVADGGSAVAEVRAEQPALALLDLMLPVKDGLTVFREWRTFSDMPVIMVTARVEEIDRLLGLELGADDYICKPFSPREVVARVKAVLRRAQGQRPEADRIVIDDARMEITIDGQRLDLTPVEFRLLKTLASHIGRIFSRDQLLDTIYDDRRVVLDRTVDSHVKNIRRKLADIAPKEDIIRSVYSVGYKLEFS